LAKGETDEREHLSRSIDVPNELGHSARGVESGVKVIFKKLLFITSVSHVGDEFGAL